MQGLGVPTDIGGRAVIEGIDHCTYVESATREREFIARWSALGFSEVVRLSTVRYPASHIALATSGEGRIMTGLSVSDDPASPVNEFVRRYGPGLQHVAYRVAVDIDFDELGGWLKANGTELMTAPLRYLDDSGAELTQLFTRPTLPYGPFVELIQRRPGGSAATRTTSRWRASTTSTSSTPT